MRHWSGSEPVVVEVHGGFQCPAPGLLPPAIAHFSIMFVKCVFPLATQDRKQQSPSCPSICICVRVQQRGDRAPGLRDRSHFVRNYVPKRPLRDRILPVAERHYYLYCYTGHCCEVRIDCIELLLCVAVPVSPVTGSVTLLVSVALLPAAAYVLSIPADPRFRLCAVSQCHILCSGRDLRNSGCTSPANIRQECARGRQKGGQGEGRQQQHTVQGQTTSHPPPKHSTTSGAEPNVASSGYRDIQGRYQARPDDDGPADGSTGCHPSRKRAVAQTIDGLSVYRHTSVGLCLMHVASPFGVPEVCT